MCSYLFTTQINMKETYNTPRKSRVPLPRQQHLTPRSSVSASKTVDECCLFFIVNNGVTRTFSLCLAFSLHTVFLRFFHVLADVSSSLMFISLSFYRLFSQFQMPPSQPNNTADPAELTQPHLLQQALLISQDKLRRPFSVHSFLFVNVFQSVSCDVMPPFYRAITRRRKEGKTKCHLVTKCECQGQPWRIKP